MNMGLKKFSAILQLTVIFIITVTLINPLAMPVILVGVVLYGLISHVWSHYHA